MTRASTQLRAGLLSLALLAVGAPAAHASLAWTPASQDYGSVNVGAQGSRVFTLTAICDGPDALMLLLCGAPPGGINPFTGPSVTGTGFSLGANTCASPLLTPAWPSMVSCTSTVNFTPPGAGSYAGTLNAPPAGTVTLSGTGIAPPASPTTPTSTTPSSTTPATKKCKKKKRAAAARKKRCRKKKKK